ncbi:substrate-binding periplasmic protein [Rhodospirillum sp. A1_3_36]|uniref:substrate-binding periplasmic protein n=1 Tax=Rhodospirillum sp. A1_3_36 TaxID=3391666 RepID=UPI0039A5C220
MKGWSVAALAGVVQSGCVLGVFVLSVVVLGSVAGNAGPARAAEKPLKVLVFERPPYYESRADGGYIGLVATPAKMAFDKAGIFFEWVQTQPNGHLRAIEANRGPLCALGWFKRADREVFGQFSDVIYTDKPSRIMTRADNVAVQFHKTAQGMLADKSLRMGGKLGYSYGSYLDGLVAGLDPPRVTVSQDETGMARMLLGGRFDYMIVSEVEAMVLMDSLAAAAEDIVLLTMSDIPPGNDRHLICSKATDPGLIARFNQALGDLQ